MGKYWESTQHLRKAPYRMLELRNISKKYVTQSFTQVALDDVSLSFRDNEFVAVLWAPRARARRPCSTSSAASTTLTRATF